MGQPSRRLLCVLAALLAASTSTSAQLQLTGIVHGPLGGAPKAVELFATADIEDLSIYGLGTANNGTGSAGVEWSFPAVALSANAFVYVSKGRLDHYVDAAYLFHYHGFGWVPRPPGQTIYALFAVIAASSLFFFFEPETVHSVRRTGRYLCL